MAITAAQVKELRELTGAGMMDCKKALKQNVKAIQRRLLTGFVKRVLLRLLRRKAELLLKA